MIEVKKLERDQWKNYELKFSYDTDGYYSFKVYDWDFQMCIRDSYKKGPP